MVRLEHANISVRDMDEAVKFLTTALPHFRIRWRDKSGKDEWLHIGTDETYIALSNAPDAEKGKRQAYRDLGVNHIGVVVDDIDGTLERLRAAGYRDSSTPEESECRRRYYFLDDDDLQWEFIQYLTDDPEKKNSYE